MKVFISWSGEASRAIAAALSEWLPDIFQDLETWMSSHDIEAGAHWGRDLHEQLQLTHFGVLCLTPENLQAPWLLFEAGSLAKVIESARVVPYCLRLTETDVPYPLAQFQGVSADKSGTFRLLESLNSNRERAMSSERLKRLFEKWWPDLQEELQRVPSESQGKQQQRTDRDLLQEILQLARQQSRPAQPSRSASRSSFRRLADAWEEHLEEIAGAGYLAELYRTLSELRKSIETLIDGVAPTADQIALQAQLERANEELDRIDPKIKFEHTGAIDPYGEE